MNTLVDSIKSAVHRHGQIHLHLESGGTLSFPVRDNPRLAKGSPEQLNHIEISPFGLHWPDLDEDLSLRGISAGNFGQR